MLRESLSALALREIRPTRYLLPGLLLVAALWLALGAAMKWDAESEAEGAARQTHALAELLAAHTTRLLGEAEQLRNMVAWEVRKHGVELPLDRYVDAGLIRLDAFVQVAVIDPNGMLRASTVPDFKPVDLSDREHFRVHLQTDAPDLFIGKPVIGRASGKPSIQLSSRIADADGSLLGVVVVSMDPAYFTRLYNDLPVGNRDAIAVVGASDMIILARRAGLVDAVGMQVPDDAGLRSAAAASSSGSYVAASFIDGIRRMTSFERLRGYPLIVTVGFSVDDHLAPYRARRNFLFAAGVLVSLLILFASGRQALLIRRTLVAAREERLAKEREAAKVEHIDTLFQAIPCAAVGLSADLELDGLNHRLLELLQTSRTAIWGAAPEHIAQAFLRDDRSPERVGKVSALAAALRDRDAQARTLTVRVEAAVPVVYEIEVVPRQGGGTVALFRDITQQTGVSESERDLDITLRAIGDAVLSTDAHGRIKRMNTMAERLTGWTAMRARGRSVMEVLPFAAAVDSDTQGNPAEDVLASGRHLHIDGLRLGGRDGAGALDVTVSAAPIHDVDGNVRGAVLVVRDITRERAAAEAVLKSEARYRELMEVLPCAVLVQQQGVVRYANPAALSLLAAPSLESLLDRHVTTLVHPDYHRVVRQRIDALQNHGRFAPMMEQTWERLDGTPLQCEVTAAPCEWLGQSSALVLLYDVSARKLAERQRDRVFELSLDMQCIASIAKGRLLRVNPAFQHVLGWTADELTSRPFMDFIHPLDRESTRRELDRKEFGVLTENFENRWRCKNGSYRWLAWNTVSEADGLAYAAARDVTASLAAREQLLRAKAEAESASRAKSAFLATMSHEIRTPMNGVIGMIEVLAQTGLSADQSNIISTVRESAASLLRIIDDILDFSKIEAGRMELELAPLSVRRLADSLCASLQPVARKATVVLDHAIDEAVPDSVMADGTRLQQLLYNLVGNAIKFSAGTRERPGRVALRIGLSAETPPRMRFSVADNGIGIASAALKTLFMPFTQAEVSTTRRFGGTGLGLAICRRIVDLMSGDIVAESRLGEGSTFSVTLPLQRASEAGAPAPSLPGLATGRQHDAPPVLELAAGSLGSFPISASPARCGRILVAEDDEINQKVILRQLGLLGYQAEIVNDGVEALEQWRSGRYALILTDLHMPRLDGYELAQTVRREEAAMGTRTPILALTANAVRGEMKRAMAVGMDGYLTKPLHLSALKDHLERQLPGRATGETLGGTVGGPIGPQTGPSAISANPPAAADELATPLDISVLAELVGDEDETIRGLLSEYRESMQRLLVQLRSHREEGMPRAISSVAHKLKSSSRSVGALPLGDLCAMLENAGKAEKQDDIDDCLARVEAESARVCAHLDSLLLAA